MDDLADRKFSPQTTPVAVAKPRSVKAKPVVAVAPKEVRPPVAVPAEPVDPNSISEDEMNGVISTVKRESSPAP